MLYSKSYDPSDFKCFQASVSVANLLSYEPLPGSKKVYVQGQTRRDIQVPFREIELSDTKDHNGQDDA